MRFDDRLLDDIKARIPPSRLIGRTVQLQRAGGSFKALSPFTKEKTPSFYVNDEKRIFKCFSSGLGGDIFKWLQLTEGLSFPEAVERLAGEAGVALPERDPQAAARDQRKRELTDWMEAAQAFFAETLRGPAGADARAYMIRRGVPEPDWKRFEIGCAPDAWEGLAKALKAKGASMKDLLSAGLVRESSRGEGGVYDYFRNRITFAIRDPSGRLVGFGARALSKEEKAKYINSPESDLFKKGEVLYRFPEARKAAALSGREAARRGLVVVEGYMDAIALAQAGVEEAVATLGTAMTPEQIDLAWRAGPRPTLFLDGDDAGIQAGYRVVDRVLPKLEPGRTMRFARLTGAKDPDELVRAEGIDGVRRVLDGAESLASLMWERAVAAHPVASPDDAAELEAALKADIFRIEDKGVQGHYRADLLAKFNAAYGYRARMRRARGEERVAEAALPVTRSRMHAEETRRIAEARRLLHALLERPEILDAAAEQLAGLEFPDPALAELRDGLVAAAEGGEGIDKAALSRHLAGFGVEMTAEWVRDELGLAEAPVIIRSGVTDQEALAAWRREAETYHRRLHGRDEQRELNEAALAGVDAGDRESAKRFAAAAHAVASPEIEDGEDGVISDAARGARVRFDAALEALDAARAGKTRKRKS